MDASLQFLSPPVLVYDRIEQNVRDTRLLIGLFVLLVLPAMAFLVEYGAVWLLMFSPALMMQVQSEQDLLRIWIVMGAGILLVLLVVAFIKCRAAAASMLHSVAARPPLPEESDFVRVVENLCIGAGLPVPALYVVDSWLPNAFSVGFSPERASLVVTRGLLDLLDRPELEGVIAHELSHIGNRDSRLNTVLSVMLRTMIIPLPIRAVLWLGMMFSLPLYFSDIDFFSDFPPSARFLMGLQTALVIWALLWPWVGRFIQHAVSRRRELLADADAVLLTRYPAGLARALSKASSAIAAGGAAAAKKSAALTNPALSHLFLLTPVTTWTLFDPHPPVGMRVAALAEMDRVIQQPVLEQASAAGQAYAESHALKGDSKAPALDDSDWLDNIPAILDAAMHGIRYGIPAMLVFFVFSSILPQVMGGRISVGEVMTSLLVSGSIGYAVAGYVSAKHFAPQRWLALLATCVMLYFVWLMVSLTLFVATQPGVADSGSGLMLRFLASLALVVIGGAVGAMLQAAVITRLFGRSLFLLWRSEQNRIGNYRLPDHADEAHAGHVARKPVEPRVQCPECGAILAGNEAVCQRCGCEIWSDQKASEEKPRAQDAAKAALLVGEAGTEPARQSPFVPAPAHRIKCPHCGAMMADSDSACVWCGHKIDP